MKINLRLHVKYKTRVPGRKELKFFLDFWHDFFDAHCPTTHNGKVLENLKTIVFFWYSLIPIRIIKKSAQIIGPFLSMLQGIFPDVLKLDKISPVYKKYNRKILENYLPIDDLR